MARPEYRLVEARSALNRVSGMPFGWSLNPYRGCTHGCHYCYARVTHGYLDLDGGRDFERIIVVKQNLAAVLRRELARPTWRFESVAIGTATDPYQPAEGTFRITRACLAAFLEAASPCTITAKGTLIQRDLDVLQDLARDGLVHVHISLITLDRDVWRQVEPGTPPPAARLRAIARLRAAGVPVSVFLMPILPGITDRDADLAAVVRAAGDHGATGVSAGVLRLAPGVKEWFAAFLERAYPRLTAAYQRGFASGANAPAAYRARIERRVGEILDGVTFEPMAQPSVDRSVNRIGPQLCLPIGNGRLA